MWGFTKNCFLSFSVYVLFFSRGLQPERHNFPPPRLIYKHVHQPAWIQKHKVDSCILALVCFWNPCEVPHEECTWSRQNIRPQDKKEIKHRRFGCLSPCFWTPLDPPGDPGSLGLDSTDTETCWESLAEDNAKDSVKLSLQIITVSSQ